MGWKIYFVALIIICVWSYIGIFSGHVTTYDYLDIPFTVIAMTGLYGYAFKKCFLYPGFWKLWLFVTVVWDSMYATYSLKYDLRYEPELVELTGENLIVFIIIVAVIGLAILLPAYIALYLYAFRSKDLWNRDTKSR